MRIFGNRLILMVQVAAVVGALALGGCQPNVDEALDNRSVAELEAAAMAWRERRLARLTEPYGWLSLVGLEFVDPGNYRVGAGEDMDIVMPAGPDHWGELVVFDDTARFEPASQAVSVDGSAGESGELVQPGRDEPIWVQAEDVRFQLIARNNRMAVRTRWPQASSLTGFRGLEYFDFDPEWVIAARFEYHPPGTTMPVGSVLGDITEEPNLGVVVFEIDGREFSLEAVASEDDDQLFFIFADRTTGRETYGAGRFLYADMPDENDRTVLDFNRAYNPPCVFTEYSTCPLPPPENRLDIRVIAGELDYRGEGGWRAD